MTFDEYIKKFCVKHRDFSGEKLTTTYDGYFASTANDSMISDMNQYKHRGHSPEDNTKILVGKRRSGKTIYLIGIAMSVLEHENRNVIFCVSNKAMARFVFTNMLTHPFVRHCIPSKISMSIRGPRGNTLRIHTKEEVENYDYFGDCFKILDEQPTEGRWDVISITGTRL